MAENTNKSRLPTERGTARMSTIEAGVERVASRIETSRRRESSSQEASQSDEAQAAQQQSQETQERVTISEESQRRLAEAQQ
jgi:hypothetical protein